MVNEDVLDQVLNYTEPDFIKATDKDLSDRWTAQHSELEQASPIGRFNTIADLAKRWLELESHGNGVFLSNDDALAYLNDGIRGGALSYVVDRFGIWAYRMC